VLLIVSFFLFSPCFFELFFGQYIFLIWPGPIPWDSLQTESLLVFIFATFVLLAFVLSFFYGLVKLFFH